MSAARIDNARKRMGRWRILRILYTGRPYPVGEGLIAEVMTDADLAMTQNEIRSALQYLADKDFLTTKEVKNDGTHVEACLRSKGVDFVEYTIPDEPGIARPQQD